MSRLKIYKIYKQIEKASDPNSVLNHVVKENTNSREVVLDLIHECLSRKNMQVLANLSKTTTVRSIVDVHHPLRLSHDQIQQLRGANIDLPIVALNAIALEKPLNEHTTIHGWLEQSNPVEKHRYYPPPSYIERSLEQRAKQLLGKTQLPLSALLVEGDYYGFIALAYHGYALNDVDKAIAWCAFMDLKDTRESTFECLRILSVRDNARYNNYHEQLVRDLDPATLMYVKEYYPALKAYASMLDDHNPPNVVEYKDALFVKIQEVYENWLTLQRVPQVPIPDLTN
jgi:hypothetical protein